MPRAKVRSLSASKAKGRTQRAAPEYVVLKIGEALEPGAAVTFVGSASSVRGALDIVHKLTDSTATRVAILERKSVIVRRPAMSEEGVADTVGKSLK